MIHEVRDRIHVRCLSAKGVLFRGFDARQGAVILSRLERISGVYKVKLYSASGEVAITFAPDKRASLRPILLDTLAYLDPNDPGSKSPASIRRMPDPQSDLPQSSDFPCDASFCL